MEHNFYHVLRFIFRVGDAGANPLVFEGVYDCSEDLVFRKSGAISLPSDIEQLIALPKSSKVVRDVELVVWRRGAGIAQWLGNLSERPRWLKDLALGWYRDMS